MGAALGPTIHQYPQDFSSLHEQCDHIVLSGNTYHHHHKVPLVSWCYFAHINLDANLGDSSHCYPTDPSDLQCALRHISMSIVSVSIPLRDTHGSPATEDEQRQTGMADVLGYISKDRFCDTFGLRFTFATSALLSLLAKFAVHTFIPSLADARTFAWLFYKR
jgi:hypothetical protein